MSKQNLYVQQGADFSTSLNILADDGTAINVAGYLFGGSIRKHVYSANVSAVLSISVPDSANGVVSVGLSGAASSNLEQGSYLYTVNMKDTSNTVTRILDGQLNISPSVITNEPVPLI